MKKHIRLNRYQINFEYYDILIVMFINSNLVEFDCNSVLGVSKMTYCVMIIQNI